MFDWILYCNTCESQEYTEGETEPTECPVCHGSDIRDIAIMDAPDIKIYKQSTEPTIEDNSEAYWEDTSVSPNVRWRIMNIDGSQFKVELT